MSTIYDAHYAALQHDLALFPDGRGRAAAKLAEIRLAVAWRYRRQLPLAEPAVTTIQYWRWFWPRIEGEVKYQELRYTLSLQPPKGRATTVHKTVLEEAGRRARHIALNPKLYKYILQGRRDQDRTLFDGDPATAYGHAEWLAALWAFERYETFLRTRYPDSFSHHPSAQAQLAAGNKASYPADDEQRDSEEYDQAEFAQAPLPQTHKLLFMP
jgi:hypothetical protein